MVLLEAKRPRNRGVEGERPLDIGHRQIEVVNLLRRHWPASGSVCSASPDVRFRHHYRGELEQSLTRGIVEAEQAEAAIARFTAVCADDPLVVAAFLGGSYAAGTANEGSDIDLYVVTEERDYRDFFSRRVEFMGSWTEMAKLDDVLDFEGLGFDMVTFECPDGVWGQLALGHTGNMMSLHGGPHIVLVDKRGLLEGVTFPLL